MACVKARTSMQCWSCRKRAKRAREKGAGAALLRTEARVGRCAGEGEGGGGRGGEGGGGRAAQKGREVKVCTSGS